MRHTAMNLDQLNKAAPSIFAQQPWERMSEKYRFFPTVNVVEALMANGFQPVHAQQSRCRIEGKENYTKHVVRFQHGDLMEKARQEVAGTQGIQRDSFHLPEVPEIVLMNSHDGTSAYKIMLGFYRLVCANGMIVKSSGVSEINVRHSGRESLVQEVIEGSYQIINEAPKAAAQIQRWKTLQLEAPQREAFAEAALILRDTALNIEPAALLETRRYQDDGKDLYTTLNVIQENLIRGGRTFGTNAKDKQVRLRGVKSVDGDTKLNRALWVLAERLGDTVAPQPALAA